MVMRITKRDLPFFTRLIIQEETSPGNATPLLQQFPVVFVPQIGETVGIEGEQGEFKVINVQHSFHAQEKQNGQGVILTVKRL